MIARFLGLVLGHELAAFGFAVKLAAFLVINLAGSISPDHSLGLCVGDFAIGRRLGAFGLRTRWFSCL